MKALITGGAGFIGTNLTLRLVRDGWKVSILDNFSRRGTFTNLSLIKKTSPPSKIEIIKADIRDKNIRKYTNADVVFHLAAQTAVTTSVEDPKHDFDVNAFGTFNLLEAIRNNNSGAVFIYSSTNKVYGSLEYIKKFPEKGINEDCPLDFHSPYGVSKGTADAYTKDYARIYDIPTLVFRQSCIYGEQQLGIEDQGWVAHMGARAIFNKPINIFGDGNQIRDLLYVDDLIDAYLLSINNIKKVRGEVFNLGGGYKNAISVNEYIDFLKDYTGKNINLKHHKIRPGDQKYFVSDNSKAKKLIDWKPKTSYKRGLPLMLNWIGQNKKLFNSFS